MRKGTDLFGLPIIAFEKGEKLDKVHDLVFDAPTNRVLGFVVDNGGLFSSPKVLPLSKVRSIGADAIIIDDPAAIETVDKQPDFKEIVKEDRGLKGKKVMTEDGKDLGAVTDLYFDEATGQLQGYEVSGGIFADAYSGRSFVPAPMVVKVGEDVVFVPNDTAALMEEQVGGIKGAVQNAGTKIQEGAVSAADKAKELGQSAGERLSETGAAAQERLQQTVAGQTADQAIGRRAMEAVRTPDGRIIIAQGQVVNEESLNLVRQWHVEQALLAATGLSTRETAKAKASDLATNARGTIGDTFESAKQHGGQLWDQLKEKAGQFKDQAAQEVEERRIKQALGRPVTRVILDEQDQVILNTGDLITHEAIERARQANALDILLNSVYTKTPELSKEDLKVRQQ